MSAMAKIYGLSMKAQLHVDATAAIGIAERKGLGKVRHLDTQSLWIQDAVRKRRVTLEKVLGTENPADLMTKHLDQKTLDKLLLKISIKIEEGRAKVAPKLNKKKPIESFEDKSEHAQLQGPIAPDVWLQLVESAGRSIAWVDMDDDDHASPISIFEEIDY